MRDRSKTIVFLASIIVAPFFFKLTGSSIELGDSIVATGSGQTLPVSVFAVALFLGVLSLNIILKSGVRWKRSPLNMPIVFLVFLNLMSMLVGLFYETRVENFLFFLQTILPLVCFFLALNSVKSVEAVQTIFVVCVWIIGTFVLIVAAFAIVVIGLGATTEIYEYLFTFPVYQLFDYVPLVVAVVYGLGLALLLGRVPVRGKLILFCFVMSMLFSIFLLRSRGALATVVVITFIQIALFARSHGSGKQIGFFFAAFGLVIAWMFLGPETLTLENARSLIENPAEDASYQTRMQNMFMAFDTILHSPLTGQMYVSVENTVGQAVIANPHNQYLTYAVRGGVISLFVYLWILAVFLRRLYSLVRRASTPLMKTFGIALFSVFLGVSLISNMLQDNFTQPYSGFFLFFLMGVGEFLVSQSRGFQRRASASVPRTLSAA